MDQTHYGTKGVKEEKNGMKPLSSMKREELGNPNAVQMN